MTQFLHPLLQSRYDYCYGSNAAGEGIAPRSNMIFTVEILSVNDHRCPSRPWRQLQHNLRGAYSWAKEVLSNEPLDEDAKASITPMRNPFARFAFFLSFQLSRKVRKIFGFYPRSRKKVNDDESSFSSYQDEEVSFEGEFSRSSDSENDEFEIRNQEIGAVAGMKYLWSTRRNNQREKYS